MGHDPGSSIDLGLRPWAPDQGGIPGQHRLPLPNSGLLIRHTEPWNRNPKSFRILKQVGDVERSSVNFERFLQMCDTNYSAEVMIFPELPTMAVATRTSQADTKFRHMDENYHP